MQNIKVIIGANYGDEGKGLAADYFAANADSKDKTINVLTNGGPQRGHTVELADGRRHVFKHFGAASFRNVPSYFAPQFMINPMEFVREYDALRSVPGVPSVYMHPECRFTTPWDMLTNQIIQEKRGIHNSCGFGVWETVLRYRRGFGISFSALVSMSREDRISWLRALRDGYFVRRLKELGAAGSSPEINQKTEGRPESLQDAGLEDFFFRDDLLFHFEEDCEAMRLSCALRGEAFLKNYQTVLFENAQGLLLDGNAPGEQEYTTPSTTGSGRVLQTIERIFKGADVEICYVTRSYLTRHGDGSMAGEIDSLSRGDLLPGVKADATNVENRFQGILRYGMMDVDSLSGRIRTDYARCRGASRNFYHPSVMITHLNEYAGIDTGSLAELFGTLYLSDGKTCRDVHMEKSAAAKSAAS